ncbi:transglutaminase domain-containing protein [Cohnella terricola]|uniref:Transglutaminase domain-containing protein n=1 Tax=Cohnella terricola TaxID=1289167 RepID=A0A559JFS8_9BACL|nr:transglutaminase-like domain-containing protein [Cohnella terricola]TVX98731.1 transglutaminase domain-containing protein [Cohnella terricola]
MSGDWFIADANAVTWILIAIVAFSLFQGIRRGASGSFRQLLFFLASTAATVVSVVLAAVAAVAASPYLQSRLAERELARPASDVSFLGQFGYTALSGLRDLPLLRIAVLFLVFHTLIRLVMGIAANLLSSASPLAVSGVPSGGAVSRLVGGAVGAALGAVRALLLTAVLFAYCALFPQGPMTDYIQHSGLYREAASQVIKPATGNLLEDHLPVFAQAMSSELDQLWQKRYDIIDAEMPDDIAQAAADVTAGKTGDAAKARALYDWVGSRISYDNEKVRVYEKYGEWREQNPEQTFATRKGVCIDYSRLYASMARAVGLDVRVVTGLGYDGRGGYGAHAWNEVFDSGEDRWIPLDSTWASTGNWFDPSGFADTHIRKGGLTG